MGELLNDIMLAFIVLVLLVMHDVQMELKEIKKELKRIKGEQE